VTTGALLWLWLAGGLGLPSADQVSAALEQLSDSDLVLMTNPAGARPVHVLVATKVAAPAEKVRRVLADPASYRKAMPSFRRIDVVSRRTRPTGTTDLQVAWELEVPAWNLTGKLWLRPQPGGVDLELDEGAFAPGLFHLRTIPTPPGPAAQAGGSGKAEHSILSIDGHANPGNANWVARRLVRRSTLVEPMITAGALYVMLRAFVELAERGAAQRPTGKMAPADVSSLQGLTAGRVANALAVPPQVLALVRRRGDGRLARVEVAVSMATAPEDASSRSLCPESFRLPGWKKVTPIRGYPAQCQDPSGMCWSVESDVPFFSLGGTWKILPQPWRARMVAGDTKGAVLGLDFLPGPGKGRTTLVVSQHPRLDQAGFLPRKLIEAEPLLEHGLSLALTIVEAVSLAPALERM
jgi:carbon monoxide dehydrogenase subunit G